MMQIIFYFYIYLTFSFINEHNKFRVPSKHTNMSLPSFFRMIHPYCMIGCFLTLLLLPDRMTAKERDPNNTAQTGQNKTADLYVISNRTPDTTNTDTRFLCTVREERNLSFLSLYYHTNDSLSIEELDESFFFSELSHISSDWLVFVHGDSKTFGKAVERAIKMQELYQVRVILFAWPSKDPRIGGGENFRNSHLNVKASIPHFHLLVEALHNWKISKGDYFTQHKLSLFLHSLGNFYLLCQVHNKTYKERDYSLFDNLIINAAAVQQRHHKTWVEQLAMQDDIFILHNRKDVNLKGARFLLLHGAQLGEKPKRPYADNAHYISFSRAIGFRFPTHATHTYFVNSIPKQNESIHAFYKILLQGRKPNLNDNTLFRPRRHENTYFFKK